MPVRVPLAHGADAADRTNGESRQKFAVDNKHFRIAALLDDCHDTRFSDHCDYENSKRRAFLNQVLICSLSERGFIVVNADAGPELRLLVTVTGIGETGSCLTIRG